MENNLNDAVERTASKVVEGAIAPKLDNEKPVIDSKTREEELALLAKAGEKLRLEQAKADREDLVSQLGEFLKQEYPWAECIQPKELIVHLFTYERVSSKFSKEQLGSLPINVAKVIVDYDDGNTQYSKGELVYLKDEYFGTSPNPDYIAYMRSADSTKASIKPEHIPPQNIFNIVKLNTQYFRTNKLMTEVMHRVYALRPNQIAGKITDLDLMIQQYENLVA